MIELRRPLDGIVPSSMVLIVILALASCRSDDTGDTTSPGGDSPPPTNPGTSNSPPVIAGSPPPSVKIGESYAFTPDASDPNGDPLTFSIEGKPAWASFESSTGALSGTPTGGDEGPYENISIAASDGEASDSLSFSITVNQVGTGSVSLSWTAPTTNSDGTALTDLAGYKIYYGVSEGNYTEEIRLENPSLSTYVVENLSPDTYYFVATSFNADGVESNYSAVAVQTVN